MSWTKVVAGLLALVVFLALAGEGASKLYHRVFATTTVGHDQLAAIACPTTLGCWAVGSTATVTDGDLLGPTDGALVELINGDRRSLPAEPGLLGDGVNLDAIACPGDSQCFAVGGAVYGAVIAHWKQGGNWRLLQHLPYRTEGRSDSIQGISCPSASLCLAYGNRKSALSYLLEWEASDPHWLPVYTPLLGADVTSIGCAGPTRCFFGTSLNGLFQRLDGQWTQVPTLPLHGGPLTVGCANRRDCIVTTTRGRGVFRWNGTSWAPTVPVTGASAVRLVSCIPNGCWLEATVGSKVTLVRQAGKHWKKVAVPAELSGELSAIGCMVTRCLAVGAHRLPAPAPAYSWKAAVTALSS